MAAPDASSVVARRRRAELCAAAVSAADAASWWCAVALVALVLLGALRAETAGDSGGDALVVSSDFFLSSEMGKEMSRLFKQVGPTDLGQCAKVNQ